MTVKEYLKQYNRIETRVLEFIVNHQGSAVIAKNLLKTYAKMDRGFQDGTQLDHTLMHETWTRMKEAHHHFHKMSFWEKIKWLLTRNQLSRKDTGTPTGRN